MKQCGVCCEPFNKSTRLEVECRYCDFSPCSTCSERYLLETTEDAHCMNCRKGWTREILVDNFSQKFVARTYKARREELLLERERSLMPATQPYVEIEKEIRRINTKIVEGKTLAEEVQKVWTSISARSLAVLAVEHSLSGEFEASILRHKLGEEQRKIVNAHMIDIQHLEWTRDRYLYRLHGGHVELEKRVFVRACPATDCRGFLSTAWKCGMCDNWACPECHEVKGLEKDAPHTCDPNAPRQFSRLTAATRCTARSVTPPSAGGRVGSRPGLSTTHITTTTSGLMAASRATLVTCHAVASRTGRSSRGFPRTWTGSVGPASHRLTGPTAIVSG